MRKVYAVIIGIFLTLLFTTCTQFNSNLDDYLSYWSAEVSPVDYSIDKPHQTSVDGSLCVPSAEALTLTVKLHNPKNFRLVMPRSSSDAGTVIRFPGLSSQPAYGTDYTLEQKADDTLILKYTKAFLEKHEWGNGDIGPEITLTSDDGRVFNKKFSINLKANTAPVLENAGIGKITDGSDEYYVLLFRVKDMGAMIGAERVHKDIKALNVTTGGIPTEIPLSFNSGNTDFEASGNLLATANDIDSGAPIPHENWVLRFKTDVKVGGPEKTYEVCIKDAQGLSSAVIQASTKKNKLPNVQLFDGSTSSAPEITGTTESAPALFAGISGKMLTSIAYGGASVTGTVEKQNGADWNSAFTVSGTTPVSINLPALEASENEAFYKITLKAQLTGYDDSDKKTFFVKLLRQELPVLTLKQDFSSSGQSYQKNISAETAGYVSEDIIPNAGNYNTATKPLVIYNLNGRAAFLIAPRTGSGATVMYQLNADPEHSATTEAPIRLPNAPTHTLQVWAVKNGTEGPKTTLYIKVIKAITTYSELKNVVQNAPAGNEIRINIDNDITAPADIGNTEIAVTGGKKLIALPKPGDPRHTINAGGRGRIFNISGSGTELTLEDIRLEGGNAGTGGAAYVEAGGILGLTGRTLVTPSTGSEVNTAGKNDVYLANGAKIRVNSSLTSLDPIVARITPADHVEDREVLTGTAVSSDHTKFTVTQPAGSTDGIWTIKNDGMLKKEALIIKNTDPNPWKKLQDFVRLTGEGSTITIDGEIKATNAPGNSGEIVIDKNLTIKGSNKDTDKLNANKGDSGKQEHRIFKVEEGKKLTLEKLTLTGGRDGTTDGGGAVYAIGKLAMTDCTVTDNETGANGGAIHAMTDLAMENCTVSDNKVNYYHASGGGAIFVYINGTHTMKNCTLTGNEAKYGDGGAVYAMGNLTMENCTLTGNKTITDTSNSGSGGAVYAIGELTMRDCTFTGNEAKANGGNGGGGAVYTKGTLTMIGGTVQNNTTEYGKGGSVYVDNGTFTMKGSVRITPSTGGDKNKKGKNDVYLANGKMITVEGTLTGTNPVARITVPDDKYSISTQVLTGAITAGASPNQNYKRFRVTPKDLGGGDMQEWEINETGFLKRPTVGINGARPGAWNALKTAVRRAQDGDVIIINGKITATNEAVAGNPNSGQIVIDRDLTIKGNTGANSDILDANSSGHNHPLASHRIFDVQDGKTLTLENLTLKNGKKEGALGGCIFVPSGKVELTNCIIENCIAGDGGAIGVKGEAKLTNTVIKKCVASSTGGAICTKGGTVTMTGCTVAGNEAKSGGGIYATRNDSAAPTLTLKGCTIGGTGTDANKATGTGSDDGSGGGICIDLVGGGTLTLEDNGTTGCIVTGNTAQIGGGIYIAGDNAEIKGKSKILNNEATQAGGGIYSKGTLTVSGNTEIKGNKATGTSGQGGGVYNVNTAKFYFNGGTISGNTAETGSGVYVQPFHSQGTMTMSGSAKVDTNNDVYLEKGTGSYSDAHITLTGALTNTPAARLTPGDYASTFIVVQGSSSTGYQLQDSDIAKFPIKPQTSPAQNWTTERNGNTLKLKMTP